MLALLGELSAVYREGDAGDERGVGAAEPQDGGCDLGRLSEPVEGRIASSAAWVVERPGGDHVG